MIVNTKRLPCFLFKQFHVTLDDLQNDDLINIACSFRHSLHHNSMGSRCKQAKMGAHKSVVESRLVIVHIYTFEANYLWDDERINTRVNL